MTAPSSQDYAGDISAQEAWDLMAAEPQAQMVDVRTVAEWNFVGLPDLSQLGRRVHCIEWQSFPDMGINSTFVTQTANVVTKAGADMDTPIVFLCRSGARSRAAAITLAGAGFVKSYNIAGGFEGDLDGARHRGQTNGWKAAGLPWRQS